MLIILNVSESRDLNIISRGSTYENENNAEKIRIIFPEEINSHNISDCVVNLNIINQNGEGDIIDITPLLTNYSKGGYYCEIDVSNKITHIPGRILMWFEIINTEYNMVAKTGIVGHIIKEHSDAVDIIPEQSISLLDDLQMKMESVISDIADIQGYVNTLKQGVVLLADYDDSE